MEERVAVLFMGIQASGKSSFYQERFPDYVHVNLDTLRTRFQEKKLLEACVQNGKAFVVDNTNPTKEDRQRYIPQAKAFGYRVVGYYFQSSVSDCIERNQKREGKARVPDGAVIATHRKMELPNYAEGFDELYYVSLEDGGFVVKPWQE